jgi:hypothetical protein
MALPLSNAVTVSISIADRAVSQQGFGTPLILGSAQAIAPDRIKTYEASTWSTAMLADGYTATDAEYLAANAMMAQSTRVNQFKIARRSSSNVPTQSFTITPLDVEEGKVYSVLINSTTFSVTADTSDTATDIATALASAVNGGSEPVTATDNTGSLDLDEDVAGAQDNIRFVGDFTIVDNTSDASVATELAAILALDTDWYGLILTSQAPAEITAAAAWAESNKKLFYAMSQSTDVYGSGSSDLASTLQDSSYNYTKVWQNQDPADFHNAAVMSKEFNFLPGTYTVTYQNIAGVSASSYTTSQLTNLKNKAAGVIEPLGGINVAYRGDMASGRYSDTTRFLDWLQARIEESVANLLINARGKVPFTDQGITQVKNAVEEVLLLGVARGALVGQGDEAPTVTAPRASAVSLTNKANRTLPDVNFTATYTGAIEKVTIIGSVSL